MLNMKTCKTCHETKPFSEFTSHTGKGYADGYEKHCKACLLQKRRRHVFTCKRCGEQGTGYRGQEFCGYECSNQKGPANHCKDCAGKIHANRVRCDACHAKHRALIYKTPEQQRAEARAKSHANYWANPEEARAIRRANWKLNYAARLEYERMRRQRDKEKTSARRTLQNAVHNGKVEKPSKCEDCGRDLEQRQVQGAHTDYYKPLDVRWLCDLCHKRMDGRAYVQA